ncbi:hypothetical protein GCM10010215_66890 [Streptomyces virginiae]|uniref:Uncharacterized protein n=1 Tax=Streptomyces virginiae TaxID=1961 RepID=A0ABQ3NNP4_STRVG|nr:hypothetical protein [Streptomyces virginiae]MBP2341738.1 hypothetical protein [Streptomyces virginiae]GGQ33506.1 hypothetical protein GCM10010215_66890 [Streptomyces virginiae]GHI14393.1 hypothetical protein Scinn_38560 [Streptomyces virginiae]
MPHRNDESRLARAGHAHGRRRSGRPPGGDRPGRPGALLALVLTAALAAAVAGAVLPHGLLLAAGLIAAAVAVIRSGAPGRDRERLP